MLSSEHDGDHDATGYAHSMYVGSLAEFGRPMKLPLSGGHLLRRSIPGTTLEDASGCYPLFACQNWDGLEADVTALTGRVVSVALVADPFGAYDVGLLHRCFPDVVIPFKEHVIVDLEGSPLDGVSAHHRRDATNALRKVQVDVCQRPDLMLSTWWSLYSDFSSRRGIHGLRAFSKRAFSVQLRTPGIVMFLATANARVVGAHTWYVQGHTGYSHLSVSAHDFRGLYIGFAMYWAAIEYFRGRVKWLDLGGGTGTRLNSTDGLARFKVGWSKERRIAYFCGRILDHSAYASLAATHSKATDYFPSYRRGEFD